jgi:hypothetical protein
VTIGGSPCSNAAVTDTTGFGVLLCTAPPGPGVGDVQLRVSVAGGGNASVPFLYAAPTVNRLSVVACAADADVKVQVHGSNLGLRNSASSPEPVVYIGGGVCAEPTLVNSSLILCTALATEVGAYPVTGGWSLLGVGRWFDCRGPFSMVALWLCPLRRVCFACPQFP